MNSRCIGGSVVFLTMALLCGCGPTAAPGAKVSGKVIYKSTPVAGAQVSFVSEKGTAYTTMTNEGGGFQLGSGDPKWSAEPGSYRITVMKLVAKPGTKLPEPMDPEQIIASGMGTHALPTKYTDAATSKLTATFNEGPNEVTLQLEDK